MNQWDRELWEEDQREDDELLIDSLLDRVEQEDMEHRRYERYEIAYDELIHNWNKEEIRDGE